MAISVLSGNYQDGGNGIFESQNCRVGWNTKTIYYNILHCRKSMANIAMAGGHPTLCLKASREREPSVFQANEFHR